MTMPKTPNNEEFPGFDHTAEKINKYVEALGIFTILLKNGAIVHHNPNDVEGFRNWLKQKSIPNIRE
ncbi:hypothetical protein [Niabella beijingensis]|uniref:hypothetical protein n=1 Tax=Niabella beijingensis TaxID=2872700 RepID=UPI001CBC04AA|nr:hypothetical protein [Niabella beijingensis]